MSDLRCYFNDGKPDSNQLLYEKNRLSERVWAYRKLGMRKEAVSNCQKINFTSLVGARLG